VGQLRCAESGYPDHIGLERAAEAFKAQGWYGTAPIREIIQDISREVDDAQPVRGRDLVDAAPEDSLTPKGQSAVFAAIA